MKLVAPQIISQPHVFLLFCSTCVYLSVLALVLPVFVCLLRLIPSYQETFSDINHWAGNQVSVVGQLRSHGVEIFISEWATRVFIYESSHSLFSQASVDNWFHVPVPSGSSFHGRPLIASPECHGSKPKGNSRSRNTHTALGIMSDLCLSVCLSVWTNFLVLSRKSCRWSYFLLKCLKNQRTSLTHKHFFPTLNGK